MNIYNSIEFEIETLREISTEELIPKLEQIQEKINAGDANFIQENDFKIVRSFSKLLEHVFFFLIITLQAKRKTTPTLIDGNTSKPY